jgi:MoaA/NifB/PqqE/SkfB family radical SAM enzyme
MADSLAGLACRLLLNGFRFRHRRLTGWGAKLQAVSLEVTQRCIARCRMCNIWRSPQKAPELTVESWLALLKRDLFSDLVELDITGGEPFLRRDLDDLLHAVCGPTQRHWQALRSIAVTTNGFLTQRVLAACRHILPAARCAGIDLVMVCAMDAIGEAHDAIRGYPGGWRRADQTIQGLLGLRAEYPNLVIGLKTTILPETVGELEAIVKYATKRRLFTIISPCIVTRGRYLNAGRAADLAFKPSQRQAMAHFFRQAASSWSFHEACLARYLEGGQMHKPCTVGFNYVFIRSQGALFPCPMIDRSPGNVMDVPIEKLLATPAAVGIRRQVGRFPECRHCTEPGLERYSLPFDGWTYLGLLPQMGRRRFLEMHRCMGLDKYFP